MALRQTAKTMLIPSLLFPPLFALSLSSTQSTPIGIQVILAYIGAIGLTTAASSRLIQIKLVRFKLIEDLRKRGTALIETHSLAKLMEELQKRGTDLIEKYRTVESEPKLD